MDNDKGKPCERKALGAKKACPERMFSIAMGQKEGKEGKIGLWRPFVLEERRDVRDRVVRIEESTGDKVHVQYFDSDVERLACETEGRTLRIALESQKEWYDFIGTKGPKEERTILLSLPSSLETLIVETTNEEILISEVSVRDSLSQSSNGGDVVLDRILGSETIFMESKNGDIDRIRVEDDVRGIPCDIKKGESNLPARYEGGTKNLDVVCNNGDVQIRFA